MQLNAAVLAPAFEESTEERGAATASDVEAIIDDASFQSREGHNRFEGGTGRLLGLDRSIYEGMIGIALLVADGWSTKEIAARLDLTTRTVDAHRHNIYKVVGVDSAVLLVRWLIREGLLKP